MGYRGGIQVPAGPAEWTSALYACRELASLKGKGLTAKAIVRIEQQGTC